MDQKSAKVDAEIRFLKGVGPQRAQAFAGLGIHTAGDLLEHFPRSYEFMPEICLMKDLAADLNVAVFGEVQSCRLNRRSRPLRFEVQLSDDTGRCRLVWFHGAYLKDRLAPGDRIAAWGKVTRYKETLQIINPRWTPIADADDLERRQQLGQPVYPATGELPTGQIARVIRTSLEDILPGVKEWYQPEFRQERQLPERPEALRWIHGPPTEEHVGQAARRLKYDELFLMELGVALRRENLRLNRSAWPLPVDERLDKRIRRLFPFDLTEAQQRVIEEIRTDLARTEPMNRLLQGDVGAGKTVVALYAALAAIGHHYQVAIMAPTEILAEQHFLSVEKYLQHSRVRRVLLTGGITGKRRTELTEQISSGEIDLVVGTQALIQQDITFNKLALVVVDEQHKFGVRQRQSIRGKDLAPHYLVMTATPIPRTLAMTVFGDLESSVINELPPGRRPIETRWVKPTDTKKAYQFIRDKVNAGEQVYFVYPRVQEKPDEEEPDLFYTLDPDVPEPVTTPRNQLKAAVTERDYLQKEIFPDFTVGLLHGQMSRDEKARVMEDFRHHRIDILVATVVIEVGVDVPNATIMVIEHADWFGLAQLHQLRGRIGRGTKKSYCLLFGEARTDVAQQRLEMMVKTNDGFKIAEADLSIRGPGQFFGAAQHGLPELKIANILEDTDLLNMARRDAFALARTDPQLQQHENQEVRRQLVRKFGAGLDLVDVG